MLDTGNMEKITIRPCAVADAIGSPEFGALVDEYVQESAISGIGECSPQIDMLLALESAGALQLFCTFSGSVICGFVTVLVTRHTHTSSLLGSIESFFVSSSFRKTGAGLLLLMAARNHARDRGAAGLFVNAVSGSRLDEVLSKSKFRHSHNVYFQEF